MIWDFQKYGNYTAILDEYGKSLTYEALDKEGRLVAEAAGRRCLAFLLCRNEIGALVGYTGMLNGGMVPLPWRVFWRSTVRRTCGRRRVSPSRT